MRLTTLASWLEGGAGFTTIARIVPGRGPMVRKQAARIDLELQRELTKRNESIVYGRVVVGETLEAGVAALLQAHGVGALRANLALFSWYDPSDPERPNAATAATMVQTGIRFGCNVGIVNAPDEGWNRVPTRPSSESRISVWWSDDRTGQLLTMLAWMCTRTPVWSRAAIDVWVATGDSAPDDSRRVAEILHEARIPAEVAGVADAVAFTDTVRESTLVLAPVKVRHGEALGPGDVAIDDLVEDLGVVVFAHAASQVELDVQPDDANAAGLATATDRATELTVRADELSQRAGTLMVTAEMLRMEHAGEDPEHPAIAEADAAASRANRTYIDALARADEAWRIVAELDPAMTTEEIDPELWVSDDLPRIRRPLR